MVSAPQRVAQVIFATSSSIEEPRAELPILALIFTKKFRPMIMGSISGWLILAGIIGVFTAAAVAVELDNRKAGQEIEDEPEKLALPEGE